MIEETNTFWS